MRTYRIEVRFNYDEHGQHEIETCVVNARNLAVALCRLVDNGNEQRWFTPGLAVLHSARSCEPRIEIEVMSVAADED